MSISAGGGREGGGMEIRGRLVIRILDSRVLSCL